MNTLTLQQAGQLARKRATLEGPHLMPLAIMLAEFRCHIESEAEMAVDEFEANAGLLLHDFANFYNLAKSNAHRCSARLTTGLRQCWIREAQWE